MAMLRPYRVIKGRRPLRPCLYCYQVVFAKSQIRGQVEFTVAFQCRKGIALRIDYNDYRIMD